MCAERELTEAERLLPDEARTVSGPPFLEATPFELRLLTPTVPCYTFRGTGAGPTVVVEAGIHGDEVAGVHALQEMLEQGDFEPGGAAAVARGTLHVVPVMNVAAYRARQRAASGGLDMNRVYPGDAAADEPERRLARRFMDLMLTEKPVAAITLHESWKRFHPDVPQSFAQTIIYGIEPVPDVVQRVVDAMNADLAHPYEVWSPHCYPVPTSSSEMVEAATGAMGLCVETWMGFDEPRRVAMQKAVVTHFLRELGLAPRPGGTPAP